MEDGSQKANRPRIKDAVICKKYSQIEKEALRIIFVVTKFYRFIHGRHFILQIDHKLPLTIYSSQKGLPTLTANRWGTILLHYNFKMDFITSSKISHADRLSRLIPKHTEPLEDTVIVSMRTKVEIKKYIMQHS